MAKISTKALEEVRRALDSYCDVCDEKLGTKNSKDTYYGYAKKFVRWLNDEFAPGEMR